MLVECKLVVVRYPPLRSRCEDQALMKCVSAILGLKLRRLKEVRCRQVWGELTKRAKSSYVTSRVKLRLPRGPASSVLELRQARPPASSPTVSLLVEPGNLVELTMLLLTAFVEFEVSFVGCAVVVRAPRVHG